MVWGRRQLIGGSRWLKAASAGENEGKDLADRAVGGPGRPLQC